MWKCGSTKGGDTRFPVTSMMRAAAASSVGSIAAISSPRIPTSATRPSDSVPPLTIRSKLMLHSAQLHTECLEQIPQTLKAQYLLRWHIGGKRTAKDALQRLVRDPK